MQYISTASDIKVETRGKVFERSHILSLYHEPPQQELTLDEFEMLSLDRLQLLRSIEVLKTRNLDEKAERQKIDEVGLIIYYFVLIGSFVAADKLSNLSFE